MALGCDTATNVTAARLTTLTNNNFTFVGRYLNRVEGYQDGLHLQKLPEFLMEDCSSYLFFKSANRWITSPIPTVSMMRKLPSDWQKS